MGGSIQISPQGIANATAPVVWSYSGARALYGLKAPVSYPQSGYFSAASGATAWVNGSWVQIYVSAKYGWITGILSSNPGVIFEADIGFGASGSQSVVATYAGGSGIIKGSANGIVSYPPNTTIWIRYRDDVGGKTYTGKILAEE